mmetsp:Transcript_20954/g.34150  ORF Transcript_20954/g.34150 Transcript_20954/m.34150 type:complete len:741 (-) Transcript_20954:24-2246(-)
MSEAVVSSSQEFKAFNSGARLLDYQEEVGAAKYEAEDAELVAHALDWKQHLTLRAIIVGALIGSVGGIILLQISLLSPITPSLNVVFSIFSFAVIRLLVRLGCSSLKFTKQENTIAQTLAMTASAGGQTCGYSTWYAAMMPVYGEDEYPGDGFMEATVNTQQFSRLIGSSVSVLFPGIFLLTFMAKFFATNEKLPFPSGSAAGVTLNAFHEGSKEMASLVKAQLVSFGKWFSASFIWTFFTSLFAIPTGSINCGPPIPLFGSAIASKYQGWGNWDLNLIFVGVGMMLPLDFVWSVVVGMVLDCFWFKSWINSHGVDIPYPSTVALWTPEQMVQVDALDGWFSTSPKMLDGGDTLPMRTAYAYKVFAFALLLLGEGFFVIGQCAYTAYEVLMKKTNNGDKVHQELNDSLKDDGADLAAVRAAKRRKAIVEGGDPISKKIALSLFVVLALLATMIMSFLYPVPWWLVLISFLVVAPLIAIPNVYFIGLQDQDVSAILGKVPMFFFPMIASAYYGDSEKGIIPGLVAQSAVIGICGQSGFLMQDFRTAFLTETSPKAMFYGQLIGATIAVFMGPATWLLFYNAFPVLGKSGRFGNLANAPAYRAIALVGAYGVDILPINCLLICGIALAIAFVVACIREYVPAKLGKHGWLLRYILPSPTAIGLAIYMDTANGNSDYPIGAAIGLIWMFASRTQYTNFYRIVAAALISGASIAALVGGIINMFGVDIGYYCLQFSPTSAAKFG